LPDFFYTGVEAFLFLLSPTFLGLTEEIWEFEFSAYEPVFVDYEAKFYLLIFFFGFKSQLFSPFSVIK